jgi:hypothetical protein
MIHLQRACELLLEAKVERIPLVLGGWVEGHPHEEASLVTRVLVGVDDVATGIGEEAADRGDQAGLVWTGEEKSRGGGLCGDAEMISLGVPPRNAARQNSSVRAAPAYLVTVSVPYIPEA